MKSLTEGMRQISEENRRIKETIIDLQARSMRDNLVFFGILEQADEDPELTIKNFLILIQTYLKLPGDTVRNIPFHQVHRLGGKRPDALRPRPIVAKFEHYKGAERNRLQRQTTSFLKKSWKKNVGSCSPSRESSWKEAPVLSLRWVNYSSMGSSTLTRTPPLGSTTFHFSTNFH